LGKREKLDFSKMKPVAANCSKCPFPHLREKDLCRVCATLMVDEDGVMHASIEPMLSDDHVREDKALRKEIRGRRRGVGNGKH